MKKIYFILMLVIGFSISSCSSEQSLQQYFVASAENPNFMTFDVPSSLLNLDRTGFTESQKKAASSLKKLNVLAFQKKDGNHVDYELQKATIKSILKGDDFSELMKVNTPLGKATIQLKGDDDTVDEIIIYGDSDEKGLLLVRVLGDDMNPASFVQLIQAMEKSDFDGKQLEQLGSLFKG